MPRIRIITIVSLGLAFLLVPNATSLISAAVAQAPSSKPVPTKPDDTTTPAATTPDDTVTMSTDSGTTDIEPTIRHKINIGRIFLNEVRSIPASQQPEEIASWLQLRLLGVNDSTLSLFLSTLELSCANGCPASVQSARGIIQFELASRNSTRDSAAIRKSRSGYHHSDDPNAQFILSEFAIDLGKQTPFTIYGWLKSQTPVDKSKLDSLLASLEVICEPNTKCLRNFPTAIDYFKGVEISLDKQRAEKLDAERERLNRENNWKIAFIGIIATIIASAVTGIMSLMPFLLDRKWPKPNANGPLLESIKAFLSKLATEEAGPRPVKTDGDVIP